MLSLSVVERLSNVFSKALKLLVSKAVFSELRKSFWPSENFITLPAGFMLSVRDNKKRNPVVLKD